jgi:hypothetical protein
MVIFKISTEWNIMVLLHLGDESTDDVCDKK